MSNRGKADFGTMGDFMTGFEKSESDVPKNLEPKTSIYSMTPGNNKENITEYDPIKPINKGFEVEQKLFKEIFRKFTKPAQEGLFNPAKVGKINIELPKPKPKMEPKVNPVEPNKVHIAGENAQQPNLFQTKPVAPKVEPTVEPKVDVNAEEIRKRKPGALAGVLGIGGVAGMGGYWLGGGAGESATTKVASAPLGNIKTKGPLIKTVEEIALPKAIKAAKKVNKVEKVEGNITGESKK